MTLDPSQIAMAIIEMPAWADVKVDDRSGLEAVELAAVQIAKSDPASVTSGMRRFVQKTQGDGTYNVSAMSNIFLLDRLIFDVPADPLPVSIIFGGFIGVPVANGKINLLWPWQEGTQLRLNGYFRGYNGEDFLATQEMDAFQTRFGFRRVSND